MEKKLLSLLPFLDNDGRLTRIPAKHKKRLIALWYLAGKFEENRQYSEVEVNELLNEWIVFQDPATLRRELFNTMLLNRTTDCRCYWKAETIPSLEEFAERQNG